MSDGDKRVLKVDVRATAAEVAALAARAVAAGLPLRDFIRRAALGVRIVAPVDPVTAGHAARLVEIGRVLASVERLALAGTVVGVPAAEIADLRRLAERAALAVLGVADEGEGEPPLCSL